MTVDVVDEEDDSGIFPMQCSPRKGTATSTGPGSVDINMCSSRDQVVDGAIGNRGVAWCVSQRSG